MAGRQPKIPPPSDPAFLEALFGEDELGVVIRAHIHIEARLYTLLEYLVPHPDQLPRLRYEQRARLACALGLREQDFPPLKILGDIRNRFGHKLETKLTSPMVDEFYESFAEDDRDIIIESHAKVRPNHNPRGIAEKFSELEPHHKFIMLAVFLDRSLWVACEQARDEVNARVRRRLKAAARRVGGSGRSK